ncbi:MAG TPA: ATP synthase F0 subunit B [Pyrinomonadaceae bacterium]|nr:ATP synthase F0 subunit B [Pyrinomonadaceae bacterium]
MGLILLGLAGNSIQLVPDGTLILHGLIILLMVVVLNRTLFKPINRILEERERSTSGLLSEAEQTIARVDESIRQHERTLREARTEGYQLLERQRAEAVTERDRQIVAAREALSKQTAAQKTEIKTQAEAARSTLSDEARRLATTISAHILGRPSPGGGDSVS